MCYNRSWDFFFEKLLSFLANMCIIPDIQHVSLGAVCGEYLPRGEHAGNMGAAGARMVLHDLVRLPDKELAISFCCMSKDPWLPVSGTYQVTYFITQRDQVKVVTAQRPGNINQSKVYILQRRNPEGKGTGGDKVRWLVKSFDSGVGPFSERKLRELFKTNPKVLCCCFFSQYQQM